MTEGCSSSSSVSASCTRRGCVCCVDSWETVLLRYVHTLTVQADQLLDKMRVVSRWVGV